MTKMLTVGMLYTNCYIVSCLETKEALVIDPGFDTKAEASKVMKEVDDNNLKVKFIINTHGHPDHISGNRFLKKATSAQVLIHELDAPMLMGLPADKTLQEGDVIQAGSVVLTVLHTPGHSRGSISLLGRDAVFTGDTLFAGSIGRTDLPGGSYKGIISSIKNKLATLPACLRVYPGHGPPSTIGEEKRSNPFLLNPELFKS